MSVINTNITSMIGQQNLNKSQNDLQTSMERLSSGLRINSAKDDAAGQAIANRMSSQITGLSQAQRNANDGISVAQTAEGALNQVNDNLQRIRELSVQAENGTNSQDDLNSIQNEINQRLGEIDRISGETSFNGTKVLQEDNTMKIQVGANDGETIDIDLKEINAKTLGLEGFNVTGAGEIDNEEATLDSLTLAGAVQQADTNEYVLSTDNTLATASDVLSSTTGEGSAIAVDGATFTVNADGNFEKGGTLSSVDGANSDAIASAMTPAEAGETVEASVTIGGEDTNISIASDGSITNADSGNTLYLDSTGNLTENAAGSPPAATIDNLSQSLATQSGAQIEFSDGTTFENTGIAAAGAEITDGSTTLTEANLNTTLGDLQPSADPTGTLADYASLSVTDADGNEETVYMDEAGDLFTDDGTTAYDLANATDLATAVAGGDASFTVETAGNGATDASAVGNTYSANYEVDLSGEQATAADINDALKAAPDATYTLTQNITDSEGNVDTQDIDFVVAGGEVTDVQNGTFTDTGTNGDEGLGGTTGEAVYMAADDSGLTVSDTTDVSYFAQENGNITNDSGQRIFEDGDGGFTTEATTESERSSLSDLDSALSDVDGLRSDLGAIQNRMESAIENLSTTETNLSAARSRIEDADYATEVANMTRSQILQQAGTSVLAQANQIPQNVLSLLG